MVDEKPQIEQEKERIDESTRVIYIGSSDEKKFWWMKPKQMVDEKPLIEQEK